MPQCSNRCTNPARHRSRSLRVCGRLPEAGADLASQPTLSRVENAVDRHACEAMAEALVTLYLRERQRSGAPTQLVLDLDGTDDPVHGNQEGGASHGFYRGNGLSGLAIEDQQRMVHVLAVEAVSSTTLLIAMHRIVRPVQVPHQLGWP